MRLATHIWSGLFIGLAIATRTPAPPLYSLLVGVGVVLAGVIGGMLPDVAEPRSYHRETELHALPLPATGLLIPLLLWRTHPILSAIVLSFCLAWMYHVISDACTITGVPILYPLSRKRLRGSVHYADPVANFLTVLAPLITFLYLLFA